jgi:hypothetical protein
VRGTIFYPEGNEKLTLAWGLGTQYNNQEEALASYMGLRPNGE